MTNILLVKSDFSEVEVRIFLIWSAVAHVFSGLLKLLEIDRMSDVDKDLEILMLRYQLGIAEQKLNRSIKPNWPCWSSSAVHHGCLVMSKVVGN